VGDGLQYLEARTGARSWSLEPWRRVSSGLRLRSATEAGARWRGTEEGEGQQSAGRSLAPQLLGGGATRERRRWLLAGPRKEVLPMGFRVIGSFRAFSSLGRPRWSNFGPNQFLKPTILRRVACMKVACQVQIRHQKIGSRYSLFRASESETWALADNQNSACGSSSVINHVARNDTINGARVPTATAKRQARTGPMARPAHRTTT
jgi:hypothetical protein